jgi:hypothetical protein
MAQEPLTQLEQELSQALGRALEKIYVQTPKMGFDALIEAYKEVESSFLPKVAGNDFLTLETKRRVAELALYSALEKKCSFELCQSLFVNLSRLGFTNLEKKSNVYLIYSRYCLRVSRNQEGIRLLEQLKVELEHELRRADMLVYRELLKTVRDVLRQCRLHE